MREQLMRRISAAIDGESLASDAELQNELRADPDASKYAKDLTRVNMWLATWPLPEPDEAALDALAARIEQRMGDSLPAIADVTAPPVFEDDDALRDATVGLLESGEHRISETARAPIPEPSPGSQPASPIARVLLEKRPIRGAVEEPVSEATGEPLSAADLELRLALDPKPKKKKKAKAPAAGAAIDGLAPELAAAADPNRAAAAPAKAKTKSGGRGPEAAPIAAASALAPVTELRRAKETKPSGAWWAFAAAACVGLGVFGAATVFDAGDSAAPPAAGAVAATTAAVMPSVAAPSEPMPSAPLPSAPLPSAPLPSAPLPSPPPPVVAPVVVAPAPADLLAADDRFAAPSAPAGEPRAAPRVSASSSPRGVSAGASAYDDDTDVLRRSRRRTVSPTPDSDVTTRAPLAVRPAVPSPAPTTATTPPAPRAPTEAEPSDLPETPDRATIQAVLQGVEAAVQACGGGEHGTADVDVVIAASGRVTTATVNGPFAGTTVGSCIARAVRGARFPPFSTPHYQVTYPFHL